MSQATFRSSRSEFFESHSVRFVFVTDGTMNTGSEELWLQAAIRLAGQNHSVTAEVALPSEGSSDPRIADFCATGGLLRARPRYTRLNRLKWILGWGRPGDYRWIADLLPDLVVYASPGHPIQPYLTSYCRRSGQRYVVVIQAASESVWPSADQAHEIVLGMNEAVACCFVSHGNRTLIERQFGTPFPDAVIVRNPFKVPYMDAPRWPGTPGLSQNWKLACVARLNGGHKGQDILFDVLALPKWRERNLAVDLFGFGPHEALFRSRCNQLGLTSVTFCGYENDVRQIWSTHHALVLPSRSEGLPLALVEALLSARPAIVTAVPGNSELIEHDVTGFVASAATSEALDQAMERAWIRRMEWKAIGERAAVSARAQIPADPAGEFASLLITKAHTV